ETLASVARELARVPGRGEDLVEDLADLPVVVDDQDVPGLLHIVSLSGCSMAATWFFPARLAEYRASSAARKRSSAVAASSSGTLATPRLAVTCLPCEKGNAPMTCRMRSAYSRAPA